MAIGSRTPQRNTRPRGRVGANPHSSPLDGRGRVVIKTQNSSRKGAKKMIELKKDKLVFSFPEIHPNAVLSTAGSSSWSAP